MLVWLNGTFGVGKTATAERMRSVAPEWRLFDPEWVGYMLRANLSDQSFSDFQELPPWRSLVPRVAREIVNLTGDRLIAVQTVLRESFWDELRAGLAEQGLDVLHVVLDADEESLRARIAGDRAFHERVAMGEIDPGSEAFRLEHVSAYIEARGWMTAAADLVVDAVQSTPEEVAAQVLAAVASSSQPRPGESA